MINYFQKNSLAALRICIGLCFLWFGILKLIPGCSPACEIAVATVEQLSFGLLDGFLGFKILGILEMIIGVNLITKFLLRPTLYILITHLIFTFSTFLITPELMFGDKFGALSLEGQYVIKNVVFIFAAFVMLAQSASKIQEKAA
ncbi:hypothetical protein JYT72_02785 [Crocinitomix catalasitica]|nr:hypothetical protein [Crocinitomix catalasitica]